MSMSYSVTGIKPADEKFNKMLSIYKQCQELNVEIPDEVLEYFDHDSPCNDGVIVEIKHSEQSDEYQYHYVVNLDDVPSDVKTIRFTMSN